MPRSKTRPALTQSTRPPTHTVRLRGIKPAALADCLEQVVAHVGDDETLPFLTAVHIRLADGRMHVMATDRYTGAIATLPASTSERARFTIPGDFVRQAIEFLRADYDEPEDGVPTHVDLTITDRLFGLTVHWDTFWYYAPGEGPHPSYIGPATRRLAVRLDPDSSVINLPALAAEALAAPSAGDPVHINPALLVRFFGHTPVMRFEPETGRLESAGDNPLAGYAVHNTGRVLVFTRPDFLGIIATVRRIDHARPTSPEENLAATRTYWRHALAAIA